MTSDTQATMGRAQLFKASHLIIVTPGAPGERDREKERVKVSRGQCGK